MEPFPHSLDVQVRVPPRRWTPWSGTVVLRASAEATWEPDGSELHATVDAASLHPIDCPDPEQVRRRLDSVRPRGPVTFTARRIGNVTISGDLTLNGITRTVRVQLRDENRWRRAEVVLVLEEWGLQPYRGRSGLFASGPTVTVDVITDWGGRGEGWVEKVRG